MTRNEMQAVGQLFNLVVAPKCPYCGRILDDKKAAEEEASWNGKSGRGEPHIYAYRGEYSKLCAECEGEEVRANSDRSEGGYYGSR